MVAVSTTTGRSIKDLKEYKAGEAFLKSKEFKRLLKDEPKKFSDFDTSSAEDLLTLRDYMYETLGKEKPKASKSADFIITHIGTVAEKYKIAVEQNRADRTRPRARQVTMNPYTPLPRIPYGTRLRA